MYTRDSSANAVVQHNVALLDAVLARAYSRTLARRVLFALTTTSPPQARADRERYKKNTLLQQKIDAEI